MSRNALILVLVVVVVVLILALSLRAFGEAQEIPSAKAEALVNAAVENMSVHGAFAEYKFLGAVRDVEETINLLTQDSKFIVAFSDRELRPFSLSELS